MHLLDIGLSLKFTFYGSFSCVRVVSALETLLLLRHVPCNLWETLTHYAANAVTTSQTGARH